MSNSANIYSATATSPSVTFSNNAKSNLGVCFSGGGSRALTCAWGQLLGMKTLGLNEVPRYISSVSGGTWASSIYSYLPQNISDDQLLGQYYPPAQLTLEDSATGFNINNLGQYNLGQAPLATQLDTLTEYAATFLLLYPQDDRKWLWASIVASFILEPFQLRNEGSEPWLSSRYFSLSESYARDYFPNKAPDNSEFLFLRENRPFIIMNNNIIHAIAVSDGSTNIVQLPNQSTPVSSGARGKTPDGAINGGGNVESYGYNSTLEQLSASTSPVEFNITQPYSLIDSVSTSSAFFAEALASHVKSSLSDDKERATIARRIHQHLSTHHKRTLLQRFDAKIHDLEAHIESELNQLATHASFQLDDIVPEYNYWPVTTASDNRPTKYTDGGTLDNLGVLGILSQTEAGRTEDLSLVIFDNTSTPLTTVPTETPGNFNIIAGSQAAPLFGINFDTSTGKYSTYTAAEQDPTNPNFIATSLIQVFDNTPTANGDTTPFEQLVEGLYSTNCGTKCGEPVNPENINTQPAFHQFTVTTIDNSLANVSGGRTVNILYIQNAKILDWQNQLVNTQLQAQISDGQRPSLDPFITFKDFPNYSTFFKIGLKEKESNALCQMWAWALADDSSHLKPIFQKFVTPTE